MSISNKYPTGVKFFARTNAINFFVLLILSLPAMLAAQVAVIPSGPTYGVQVLPGSNRQINVNITGGSLNTVNWSVLSATGGASATFTTPAASNVSTVTDGLPTVLVTIGPVAGNCSIPQASTAVGTYTVTSTARVTVQAQSVDDPTKTGIFQFNVCAKTTTVMIAPAYQQAFMGQHRMLQSWVSGDADETGTWNIVSQPSGGNAVLADTTNRDADFMATVTGRYVVEYTSHSNPSKTATAIVYVSPNPLPAYASTPNKTEPRECFPDPALTGGDFEVGAGKKYPNLESTPVAGSLKPGSIIRVWNTDTTGTNPSTYHEYYQISASGTPTQPMILCGVADALGNLPVIDGSNATGQPSVSEDGAAAGAGIISIWPGTGTPYGYWQTGSAGPSYVTVTGLHVAHGTPNYNYTPPTGGPATAYEQFTSCLNVRSGSYVDLGGNHLDTCGLGVFTADNGNNAWSSITQLVTITGNHVQNAGISGQDEEHGAYIQTWYALLQGNLFDNYNPQASGSAVKWRGVEGIFRYNNIASGPARMFDLVDVQDADPYVSFESYLSAPGDTNCDDSMYCLGDKMGANVLAGYQESFQKDFLYGNELWGSSTAQQIHYLADGGSGMQTRNGTMYFFSNTLDAAQVVFDNGSDGNGFYGFFPVRVDARNNILWATQGTYKGSEIQMAFATTSTIIMSATTNLMKAGTFTIQPPIMGAPWQDNTEEGWSNTCDGPCQWPLSIPLDPHLYGLSNANYLTSATQPYDPTTMIPPAGSAAIDAGSPLTDILATMPVRWQYSVASNSLIPRLNPQTIGAADYAAVAATPSFSPAAGDFITDPIVTIETSTPSATIYYTTDGSTPTSPPTGTTQLYSGPINVNVTETVQAIAVANGYVESTVGTADYQVGPLAATPAFTPAGGTYTAVQTVTISDATTGTTIYYTTDGTTPSTGSAVYSGPITVNTNETIQAIAAAGGYSNSSVGSAVYTINIPQSAQPTFSPAAGVYTATQTVTISDTTSGATIYFTTDGTTPTAASAVYSGPITVSASETVQAIAIASGDSPSAVAKAIYAITLPFAGPTVAQQCNTFMQFGTSISCTLTGIGAGHTLVIGISTITPGQVGTLTASSGTPVLATTDGNSLSAWILPNTTAGSNTITYSLTTNSRLWLSVVEYGSTAASPLDGTAQADLSASWQGAGLFNTPNLTTSAPSDALWSFCLGDQGAPTVGTAPVAWTALPTPTGGNLLIESGGTTSAGIYYGQCAGTEGEIIALALKSGAAVAQAATPTFNVAGGTYTSAQSVTISDSTSGATIYYTTDGTTPSFSSNVYSGPIAVSASETLEAIAISSSTALSNIASAAYTINIPLATPPITWPTPVPISYGTPLTAAQLDASSTVAGTFSYFPALGAVLTSGGQALTVVFTPTVTTEYSTATTTVTLTVNKVTPAITWASPAAIAYGTALTSTQLDAASSVPGSFSYSPASGILTVGNYTLNATFSPTDTVDYNTATATVTLTVVKATPAITWATPASIPFGTALSATQLDATTSVAGTFNYSPALGTVLPAGSQSLTVTFKPTDTIDYAVATASVTLTVIPTPTSPTYVQQCNQYTQFGTSASCTLTGVGAGHTLVIGIAGAGTIPGSVTASVGTPVLAVQDGSYMSAYVLANSSAGSIKITYTATGNTKIHMSVVEYANTAAAPLDGAGSFVNKGDATTISSSSFITTTSGDLLWSYCGTPGGSALNSGSAPIAWTKRPSPNGTGMPVLVEDGVTTTPGAYYGQCIGANDTLEIVTIALKP
jgi:hypothetical protein